jgi:hypothetical protein
MCVGIVVSRLEGVEMPVESYNLKYAGQTDKALKFFLGDKEFWLPKSQIEVDGVVVENDFKNLIPFEQVDVYIPDWLAEDKGLL